MSATGANAEQNLNARFRSLGFVGAGNMAGAIMRGIVGRGLIEAQRVWAADIDSAKLSALRAELGIRTTLLADELAAHCDTIVLAVKPQQMDGMLATLRGCIESRHCIVSIAAGVGIARIAAGLGAGTRIVRVMPNTPALVGEGAAGVASGPHASRDDLTAALALFNAVGKAVEVEEALIDAVTALSGSGPAYCFRMMEAMMSAGEKMGMSAEVARNLTLQTFVGAAKLAASSGDAPAELRRRVTSPGGTTEAALKIFDEAGFAEIVERGVLRARDRSVELSK